MSLRLDEVLQAGQILREFSVSNVISLDCDDQRNPPVCTIRSKLAVSEMAKIPNAVIMTILIVSTKAGRFLQAKGWKVNY